MEGRAAYVALFREACGRRDAAPRKMQQPPRRVQPASGSHWRPPAPRGVRALLLQLAHSLLASAQPTQRAPPLPAGKAPAAKPAPKAKEGEGAPESARGDDRARRGAPRGGAAPRTRGGRGGFSGRGREFDRISGTGRGKEVSKDGAGPNNWGSASEEARKAENGEAAAEGEAAPEGAEGAAAEGEAPAPESRPEREQEPEVKTRTIDEELQERNAKRTGALFEVVKVDNSKLMEQFKGECGGWSAGDMVVAAVALAS